MSKTTDDLEEKLNKTIDEAKRMGIKQEHISKMQDENRVFLNEIKNIEAVVAKHFRPF